MEEKNKKVRNTSRIISFIFVGLAVLIIVIGVGLLTNSGDKKKSGNYEADKPQNQNDVVLDSFTYSFLKLETNKNNLVYSPLSIKYALSMLSDGANGQTKEEIDKVIKDLGITKYENIDKVLSLANSVFIRDTFKNKVKEEYTTTLKQKYNAEVIYDEFKDAKNVNDWIEEKTFGLIKNMLRDEQVQDFDVEMLLINALAIDMGWSETFSQESTTSRPFTNGKNEQVDVAMMHKTTESKNTKFYQDEEYSIVSLPFQDYNGTKLEFVAIMPNEKDLDSLLLSENFDSTINGLLDKLRSPENEKLSISLPRFDFEYKASIKSDLQKIGIQTVFSDAADLSGISSDPLKADDVLHKATIKCSEKGVKAAAATVIILKDNAAVFEPEEKKIIYLNYNKPFLFIIRDSNTKEVWFTGTVYEPLLWANAKKDYNYE